MGNMYCLSQKANSKDWNNNFNRIFKKQFFDGIDKIDEILEEANKMDHVEEVREQHKCKMCGEDGGVVCSTADWEEQWNGICDGCAFKLWEGRI